MRFILLENDKVIGVRYGSEKLEGEVQSDLGELGQIMQTDGTFITPESLPIESQPTIEEQILYENKYQTMLLEMTTLGGM